MTITISGHYDVNEAPEEGWLTDPWELAALDGFLYGRGVSDCKGPIIATLSAVRELVSKGELKVNVIFVFDGMNENGCLVSGCSLEEGVTTSFFLAGCGRFLLFCT